jgi:hypothetical protein
MGNAAPTPQINVSKIPGGTGIAGALFAIGSMLIFLLGVPRIRYFFYWGDHSRLWNCAHSSFRSP